MLKPTEIGAKAHKLENENLRFRTFLKNRADDDKLDAQFLRLHNELFADYDCQKCGNCCRAFQINLGNEEATAIAAHLGQPKDEFMSEHIVKNADADEDEGEYAFKAKPCEFLDDDGHCRIQDCKPDVCKGFPYTDKPERLASMYSILASAEICPVVFEILERLKKIYDFRSRN